MNDSGSLPHAKPNRPPLRAIGIAWGESYVDTFLDLCLPALLAPGNLPVLAEHFAVELVFVTETRFFDRIRNHPSFRRAAEVCTPRLVPVDDLLTSRMSYGLVITYSLFRGFKDLGPAMTECQLVFICADFILADGSYRNLLPHLLRSERIVYSPSYCTIAEDVRPSLLAARAPDGSVLAMPPREMADLVIRNRHFTMRAKTVNQRFFHLSYTEQFYWVANESTILGRQMPIALVAMKPERFVEEVAALWDYGLVAEFCPSMKYTVLGDSDDFLMLELREHDTASPDLSLGWPTSAEIAAGLATFITDYKKTLGRERLILHSRALPPDVEQLQASLDRELEAVYAKLPAKLLPLLNHPQWTYHFDLFRASPAKSKEAASPPPIRASGPEAPSPAVSLAKVGTDGLAAPLELAREGLRGALARFDHDLASNALPVSAFAIRASVRSSVENVDQILALESARAQFVQEAIELFERQPWSHGSAGDDMAARITRLRDLAAAVSAKCSAAERATQNLLRENILPLANALGSVLAYTQEISEMPRGSGTMSHGQAGPDGIARRVSRVLFGAAPRYRSWHWLHSPTRLAISAAEKIAAQYRRILLLQNSAKRFSFVQQSAGEGLAVPVAVAHLPGVLRLTIEDGAQFDACIIETDVKDLARLSALYDEVRPLIRPGGVILGLFLNPGLATIPRDDPDFVRNAFPVCGPARVAYSGSWASAAATRVRRQMYKWLTRRRQFGDTAAVAISMAVAAPLAALGSLLEARRTLDNSYDPPKDITSVTVEIQVG
jgi:hypothetical protein